MMPFWAEAADRANREGIVFLGVLLAAERPPSISGSEWPLYTTETVVERRTLAIPVVPLTVVVDRSGAVTRVWRGARPMRVIADILRVAGSAVAEH